LCFVLDFRRIAPAIDNAKVQNSAELHYRNADKIYFADDKINYIGLAIIFIDAATVPICNFFRVKL